MTFIQKQNALVAEKVLGIRVVQTSHPIGTDAIWTFDYQLANYFGDLVAAWKVVDKLRSDGFTVRILALKHGYSVKIGYKDELETEEYGDSISEAICHAALKVVGHA